MDEVLAAVVGIFAVATAVTLLFQKLHIPGIVALIISGLIIGPHGAGLLEDHSQIALVAEFGIILLMFSIGLDFNRDRLIELRRAARIGFFQLGFCIVIVAFGYYFLIDPNWPRAILAGFLVSHTSSTLMLKIYSDRGEISTAPCRLGLGVSITQDLSSVPMLIVLPLMALGQQSFDASTFPATMMKGTVILLCTGAAARWLVSPVLALVIRSRNRELILFFLMLVCLGASWATYAAGLSAALGAFVAGLTLAGSHYSHQVRAEVSPIRDLLVSLFFISVGMLLNTSSLVSYAHIYIPALIIILPLKFFSAYIPVLRAGYPLRIAVLTGTNIAQIGEFSFVVALVALGLGLMNDTDYQIFIITGIISMLLNPFVIASGPRLSELVHRLPFSEKTKEGRFVAEDPAEELDQLEGHVIIAGYGVNGRNIARSLTALNIPHAALELSPETVAEAQDSGEPVYYGDCTRPDILRRLRIDRARVFVVAISDAQATRRAVQVARIECPNVHIIVRTRYLLEIEHLLSIGADEVIPEEFETSLEILARTLQEYQVPRKTIDQAITNLRSSEYEALRTNAPLPRNATLLGDLSLALEIESTRIEPGFDAIGKTLQELSLPSRTGVVILAVRKGDEVKTPPSAAYRVSEGDMLIMVGTNAQLIAALDVLEGSGEPRPDSEKTKQAV